MQTSCRSDRNESAAPVAPAVSDDRIEHALRWLSDHFVSQPSLAEAARAAGMSEFHFQRLFNQWVGLSPKKYVQYLTLERAKRLLDESRSVLDAAFEAGLSGGGRLHDLFVSVEALTPGEYKSRGDGLTVHYGFHASPFGDCLLMSTDRGLCGLAFCAGEEREAAIASLSRGWENASLEEDPARTASIARRVFHAEGADIKLLLRGTPFQIKVWEALLRIPPGAITTYADVAHRVESPRAMRAVGGAIGANPIAYLIPCHRVIRGSGLLGGYRWGPGRKLALLSVETGLEAAL